MPYSECTVSGVEIKEEFIRVSDGVVLKVIDFQPPENNGPVLIFVAGWISLISGWREVLMELTPQFRTLYVETREKISAQLPEGSGLDFSVTRMALDLDEIVETLVPSGKKFAFAGSSLGSTIVLDHLSRNVRQPCMALLVGPVPKFRFPAWGMLLIRCCPPALYLLIKPIIKWYLKYIRVDRKKEPAQVEKYHGALDAAEPARLKANALRLAEYSLWEKLPQIQVPVVVIGAKSDSLHGLETLEKIVELTPNAVLAVLDSNKDAHSEKAGRLMVERLNNFSI